MDKMEPGDVVDTDLGPLVIPEGMGGHYVVAGSLDAAWAGAEAALPDDRLGIAVLGPNRGTHADGRPLQPYTARAYHSGWVQVSEDGPTPAAALRALATKLRERSVSGA